MKPLHSFSRRESEIETARDREREVKMKKKIEKRESRWSLQDGQDFGIELQEKST